MRSPFRKSWLNKLSRSLFGRTRPVQPLARNGRKLNVELLEDRVVPTNVVTTLAASGSGSLAYAITNASTLGNTITFQSGLSGTINSGGTLAITSNITIDGPGANVISVSSSGSGSVFSVTAGATTGATISGLTITGGLAGSGSGINNAGHLTLSGDAIVNNGADNNTTNHHGGGIYNSGTLTISDSTISGNYTFTDGGGIENHGTLSISNSTITGNGAYTYGGGIYNVSGTLTLTSSTVASNVGWSNSASYPYGGGGGIEVGGGTVTLDNTIVNGNNNTQVSGSYTGSYNLVGTATGLSSTLAYSNGSTTQTLALSSGSNAVGTGDPTQAGTVSQNGITRSSTPSIGAFEVLPPPTVTTSTVGLPSNAANLVINGNYFSSTPANDSVTFDNGVSGTVTAATGTSLTVSLSGLTSVSAGTALDASVTANGVSSGSLVQVATVAAPITNPVITSSTANIADNATTITINGSYFDPTVSNNTITFSSGVVGTITAGTSTQLIVTLTSPATSLGSLTAVVTTNGAASSSTQVATETNATWNVIDATGTGGSLGDVTLPYAASHALSGDTITFDSSLAGATITLSNTLALSKNLTITGPGAANLSVSGVASVQVFSIGSTATDTISGLTIENGVGTSGGGIKNQGTLTLSNDLIFNNGSPSNTTNDYGAGIWNSGTLTVNDTTIAGNTAYTKGGGLYNTGSATLANDTIFANGAYTSGGGIYSSGTLVVTSSTIVGNTGWNSGTPTGGGGGIRVAGGTATIDNTIVSGNSGSNVSGTYTGSYNLIGGATGLATSLDFNNGAATETLALMPGSNAIGAGDPAQAGTTSQNGVLRGSAPDIGAFQSPPTLTANTANLADSTATLTLTGTGFDSTAANDVVTFSNGMVGSVSSASSSSLTVNITTPATSLGSLTAVVTVDGNSTGAPVQVATLVNGTWTVTDSGSAGSFTDITLPYAVNHALSGDTIDFASSLSGDTISTASTLTVGQSITITGLGANVLAINGNNSHEVFSVSAGVTATISGLTITNGLAASGSGIYNHGTLTLTGDSIVNNGAITNETNHYGAGIRNSGTLTVTDSTIAGNTTFTDGGGLYNTGTATLTDSTIVGNRGYTYGGGIWTSGALTLTDCTVSQNAGWGNDTLPEFGGGIYISGSPTVTLDNTIVAGNSASSVGPDIDGSVTANYSLFSTTSGATISGSNNITTSGPGLASSLAYNAGGTTQTLAVLPGSPAIGAGDPSQAGTLDQNGTTRSSSPTIGAYQPPPPTVTMSTANLPVNSVAMYVYGTGFDTNAANDIVTFDNGVIGTVDTATPTSLLVSLSGLSSVSIGTALDASATVDGVSSGSLVQVATVGTAVTPPTIMSSTANLADSSTTLTITGSNFDTTAADNTVTFNLGLTGTVTAATATQLTVTISNPPNALGNLTAIVTSNGSLSGAPVQVATEVSGTWTVTDAGSGAGSFSDITLPYALAVAQNSDSINFDSSLSGDTITLPTLFTFSKNVTITGLGASSLAISGGGTHGIFSIPAGLTENISGLTIENGHASTYGGGIYNLGALTLSNDVVSGNTVLDYGGAIYNTGTLTLNSDTFSGNSGYYGGAFYSTGTLTANDSTFTANAATYYGGVLYGNGTMTFTNSTLFANTVADDYGGAIYSYGTLHLISDTISGNSITSSTFGYGGGIYSSGTTTMDNTIVAGNSAFSAGPDIYGTVASEIYSLIGNTANTTITSQSNSVNNVSANLASALADNGGTTETLALQTGSPAFQAGDPGQTGTLGQNGIVRLGLPDIGAYQTPASPPTVTANTTTLPSNAPSLVITGTNFSPSPAYSYDTVTFDNGVTGTVYAATLTSISVELSGVSSLPVGTVLNAVVTVAGQDSGTPVQVATIGSTAIYPAITAGTANLADSSTTVTISGSNFDTTPANNTVAFNFGVSGTVTAATATQLTVTISAPPTALGNLTASVTTDGNNSGAPVQVATVVNGTWTVTDAGSGAGSFSDITLPYAVATALNGDTINFAAALSGSSIAPTSTLAISKNLTITGLGASNLAISGSGTHEIFSIPAGVTASISGLTLENGHATTYGGGIYNLGTLSLSNDVVSGNTVGDYGGAVYNTGTLTLNGDTFSGNTGLYGGAFYNTGTLTANGSTFTTNTGTYYGGVVYGGGTMTFNNSTLFANTVTYDYGGAIYSYGTLHLTNDTIAGNSILSTTFGYGGGIYGTVTTMDNTIVAGNSAFSAGPDIYDAVASANYSLIGNTAGNGITSGSNNLTNVSPNLASALANNGGTTQTLALLPGSTAAFAGDPTQAGTVAQNGVTRTTAPSIGAYQVTPPTLTSTTANLPVNSPAITLTGTGFDPNIANDTVTFDNGVSGTVVSASGTSLVVTLSGLSSVSIGTVLHASVTVDGISTGSLVPVATVSASTIFPVVTANTANLADTSATITITGSNFDPVAANNTITFNLGVVGTVTAATSTQLTVAIATPPNALGSLTAIVTTDGIVSGAPVQVATVVNGTWTVTDASGGAGSGTDITLPYAVSHSLSGDTIDFASSLSGATITTSATLTLGHNLTITGLGANVLAVSGNNAHEVLSISTGVTVAISGLTITDGLAEDGSGIYNQGTLTLTNDSISGNNATSSDTGSYGVGVYNTGTLTVTGSTFTGNNAYYDGGAIYSTGTATLTNDTIFGNTAFTDGGGIENLGGTLSLTDCTVAGNTGWQGENTSFPYYGGGIYTSGGTTTLDNTIVAGNHAVDGGPDIYGSVTANYSLFSTTSGATITGSNNITSSTPGLATALAYNAGGTTQTLAALPGSPAIGAGDPSQAGTLDQNGTTRPATPTIGAYQPPPPVITPSTANLPNNAPGIIINGSYFDPNGASDIVTFDNGVTGTVFSATSTSLILSLSGLTSVPVGTVLDASVTVDGASSGSLVPVATVGTSATFPVVTPSTANLPDTSTSITINGSNFDPTVANNTVAFNLGVVGTVTAATATQLTVTITAPPTALGNLVAAVTTDGNHGFPAQVGTEVNGTWTVTDAGSGAGSFSDITLPYALATAQSGDTINFDSSLSGDTITLPTLFTFSKNVTITGLGASSLAISGGGTHGIFSIPAGLTENISGLTIENGHASTYGGGIYNLGALTLSNDVVSGNTVGDYGGAVYNTGTLTLNGDTFSGNTGLYGGAFYNTGTLTANGSTFTTNTGIYYGGVVYGGGTMTFTNSTLFANTVTYDYGGAIYSYGTLHLISDTISGNSITSSTFGYGGGIYSSGTTTMDNTIVAGNSAFSAGPDIYGTVASEIYSLIGNTANTTITSQSNSINNVSPDLASALADNGGTTQTLALLTGSPAIGAGDPSLVGTLAQNGNARGPSDIGAYQSQNGSQTVTPSTANLADTSTSIVINGSNFDPIAANDSVVFNLGVVGTVTSATATQLTVTITTPPTAIGALDAIVYTDGLSVAPVQVATEVNGTWVVTDSAGSGGSLSDVTLPYAVSSALGGDTITFDNSLSGATISPSATLNVASSVTITGLGAANLAVSGGNSILVFNVASGVTASISGLTIEDGANGTAGYGNSGGGVANSGTLSLSNDLFTGNSANNSGGGVYNNGTLTVTDSTFSDNTSPFGAGIDNSSLDGVSAAVVTLNRCTFTGNTATAGSGSGINNWDGNSLTLSNSTVTGNSGGAAAVYNGGGSLILISDTIAYNDVGVDTTTAYSGTTTINNTIVTGNTSTDINGTYTDNGYNLIGSAVTGLATTLAYNNGAPTETLALSTGSSAIGAGDPSHAGTTAQNGVTRPTAVDIGAYQTVTATPISIVSRTVNGDLLNVTSTISSATEAAGSTTVQITTSSADGLYVGEQVKITGVGTAAFNGTYTVASVIDSTDFTYIDTNFNSSSPGSISNGGSAVNALGGAQRSMVDSITYKFNQAVTLGSGAISMDVNSGYTGTAGVVPTISYATIDDGHTWIVTFSGSSVTGNSIADGVYDITLNASAVTADVGTGTLASSQTDTFFRLFGDSNGDASVTSRPDVQNFAASFGTSNTSSTYLAYFDYNADGSITSRPDVQNFATRFGTSLTGFTPTI